MAERRISFLRTYLQELELELAEGGSGYAMSEEITLGLLWQKHRGGEDFQHGRVVEMFRHSEQQHSA